MRVSMMISESRRVAQPSYLRPAIVSVSPKHRRTVRAVHGSPWNRRPSEPEARTSVEAA